MTSRSLAIALLSLAALLATAPLAAAQAPPTALTLSTGWEHRLDGGDLGQKAGWSTGAWKDDWEDVEVPHVFKANPLDIDYGGTIGWYRLKFDTPNTPPGFAWDLRFEGVRRAARVWLNGKQIGRNSNPYQPFTLHSGGLRTDGKPNELVVRVHNIRPAELREGWWNWGGIVRDVKLIPVGRVVWEDVGVLSDVDCTPGAAECGALVRTDGWLHNRTAEVQNPLLILQMKSPAGEVFSKTVTARNLKPGESRRVGFPMKIPNAQQHLWSPGKPNLYNAYVEVKLGPEIQQAEHRRVGLRYIRVNKGRLELNGRPLSLRGASIQEDVPGRGPALRDVDIEKIIGDLKALSADVTRAQYPLSEKLLSRLDEEGIMVWSQAPVYHEDRYLVNAAGRSRAYAKVRGTILYARNHPSVLTHSVANELTVWADEKAGTKRFLETAAKLARDLDHTVPASADLLSYPRIPRQEAYAAFGLLGLNSYYGWYRGKTRTRSTAKLSDLWPYLRDMKKKYPDQAMMITEFGAEATFEGPETVKETFAFQARYVDRTLDIVNRANWLSGAIYWTAREFYVKPNWDGGAERPVQRDALHNKGLIAYDGDPKPAFYEAKRHFEAVPTYKR